MVTVIVTVKEGVLLLSNTGPWHLYQPPSERGRYRIWDPSSRYEGQLRL
jgi:hypothetical protein